MNLYLYLRHREGLEHRNGSVSDPESEVENEEGDYTVYECPGFATVWYFSARIIKFGTPWIYSSIFHRYTVLYFIYFTLWNNGRKNFVGIVCVFQLKFLHIKSRKPVCRLNYIKRCLRYIAIYKDPTEKQIPSRNRGVAVVNPQFLNYAYSCKWL